LPVCNGDRLVGMLTDREIIVGAVAEGRDPAKIRVQEVMNPEIIYCFDDQDVEHAAALMEEKQVRRLVVLDRSKRLAGILSVGDIARKTADEILTGEIEERVAAP